MSTLILRVTPILLLFAGSALGHSDPWGDIHPQVEVMDGKFAITFNTNLPDQASDYTEARVIQRIIHNADGSLFAPRHPLSRKRSWKELGPIGLYGRGIAVGSSTVTFHGDQSGKPGYVLKSPNGKLTKVHLPWPAETSLTLFEDAVVTAEGIAITGKEDREDLMFYWFDHESVSGPVIQNLGATAMIYNFPTASNIAFAGERFWIAYMKPTTDKLELALWSWKPGEKESRVEILDSPADWNSKLSLAAIDDRLCLAYHCVVPSDLYTGLASIVTVFRKAE